MERFLEFRSIDATGVDGPSDPASLAETPRHEPQAAITGVPSVASSSTDLESVTNPHAFDRYRADASHGDRQPHTGTTVPVAKTGPTKGPSRAKLRKRNEAISQSLMLLVTMSLMLLAARFAVPQIVEEIRYAWHRGELRAQYESGTDGLRNVSLDALSDAYQMVTDVVGPSVVHIDVQRPVSRGEMEVARMLSSDPLPTSDQGSGVVVDEAGYILTNRHVIADGDSITVTLSDGRRAPATVVGMDVPTDLALLKVNSNRLFPIVWGDSDRARVGSPVWAIGSPFGLDRTVTFGILSGKHRMVRASTRYQDFMQSDVAVNPGNSGGPLVDSRGALIGINTAIVGDTYQGVSFSIPSNVARQVYDRLKATGRVERAFVGISLAEVPDELLQGDDARTRGALVVGLQDTDCPAARAGIQTGDVILAMNEQDVRDVGHLMRMIGDSDVGATIHLQVHRNPEKLDIAVLLGQRPPENDR